MRKIKNDELGRKSPEEYRNASRLSMVIVLDNVRSLHNVGSVFRTADAFLCDAVYLCGITAQPPHREMEKTALRATESVPWKHFAETREALVELKSAGHSIIAIEQVEGAFLLQDFAAITGKKYALVFGHEINGVDEKNFDLVDVFIEIPQSGTKHSLNISVSAGVVLWEFYRQLTGT
jgi:23S rRNA (guanosine2251-2'-O)-methyltransferase